MSFYLDNHGAETLSNCVLAYITFLSEHKFSLKIAKISQVLGFNEYLFFSHAFFGNFDKLSLSLYRISLSEEIIFQRPQKSVWRQVFGILFLLFMMRKPWQTITRLRYLPTETLTQQSLRKPYRAWESQYRQPGNDTKSASPPLQD